jgi:hypothetical protein
MSRPASIESLRKRIALLQAERDELQAQRRSRSEIGDQLDATVNQWATAGTGAILREFQHAAAGHPSEPLTLRGPVVHLGPVLCAMLGASAVKAALLATLAEIPAGMPTADRLARLREINTSLDDLETTEEKLVVESGVERRADCRPEIVIGC